MSFSKSELYEINDALHEVVTRMCVQGQTQIEIREQSLRHLWNSSKKVTVMLLGDDETPAIRDHETIVFDAIANPKLLPGDAVGLLANHIDSTGLEASLINRCPNGASRPVFILEVEQTFADIQAVSNGQR